MDRDTESRRLELRDYARDQFTGPASSAQALVNIVSKSVALAIDAESPGPRAQMVMDDLMAVLVGDGMRDGRGSGTFYVSTGFPGGDKAFWGDDGFKPEFRDKGGNAGFQVQHAVAGLVMSYRYGPGIEWYARRQEPEPEDDALYDATFAIGNWLAPWDDALRRPRGGDAAGAGASGAVRRELHPSGSRYGAGTRAGRGRFRRGRRRRHVGSGDRAGRG